MRDVKVELQVLSRVRPYQARCHRQETLHDKDAAEAEKSTSSQQAAIAMVIRPLRRKRTSSWQGYLPEYTGNLFAKPYSSSCMYAASHVMSSAYDTAHIAAGLRRRRCGQPRAIRRNVSALATFRMHA